MDLERAASGRCVHRSAGYGRVESARSSEQLLTALLNWNDPSMDAHEATRGIFADLLIHQVALLDGVMRGVQGLLTELSPEAIETQSQRSSVFANRHKDLWKTYRERHAALAETAVARTFGKEFAAAYSEYQRRQANGL